MEANTTDTDTDTETETEYSGTNGHAPPPSAPAPAPAPAFLTRPRGLPEREQRELVRQLTEAELLARGEEMAKAELEQDKLKAERRGINGQIADLRASCAKLAEMIEAGEESRMVDCAWIEDLPQNRFKLVAQDTGEEIDSRALTAAELQGDLFGGASTPMTSMGTGDPANDNADGEDGEGPGDEDGEDEDGEDGDDTEDEQAAAPVAAAESGGSKRKVSKRTAKRAGKGKRAAAKGGKGKGKPKGNTRHIHA